MSKYYYWMDTNYCRGDYNVLKFALIRGEIVEGEKDRTSEEIILWAVYEDVPGYPEDDNCEDAWNAIDAYIEEKLGFLPEYEVN